jgi:hypothetical protein
MDVFVPILSVWHVYMTSWTLEQESNVENTMDAKELLQVFKEIYHEFIAVFNNNDIPRKEKEKKLYWGLQVLLQLYSATPLLLFRC